MSRRKNDPDSEQPYDLSEFAAVHELELISPNAKVPTGLSEEEDAQRILEHTFGNLVECWYCQEKFEEQPSSLLDGDAQYDPTGRVYMCPRCFANPGAASDFYMQHLDALRRRRKRYV